MTSTETVLLMHFLDKVFPLQYPLYTPNIIQGGRGWVLSLLLRNAPLYHAALALSAFHRKSSLLVANWEKCRMVSETQQETHLSICLTEFQNSIRNLDQWLKEEKKGDILGIMASIVQLVYFEVRPPYADFKDFVLKVYAALFWQLQYLAYSPSCSYRPISRTLYGSMGFSQINGTV